TRCPAGARWWANLAHPGRVHDLLPPVRCVGALPAILRLWARQGQNDPQAWPEASVSPGGAVGGSARAVAAGALILVGAGGPAGPGLGGRQPRLRGLAGRRKPLALRGGGRLSGDNHARGLWRWLLATARSPLG